MWKKQPKPERRSGSKMPGADSEARFKVEAPGRVELPTNGLGNRCSIHLSYGAI